MSNVMEFMSHDHDSLDEIFTQFKFQKNEDLEKAKTLFTEFRAGLEKHIVWEEEILFPIFEKAQNMHTEGPTAVMREEHVMIKAILDQIQTEINNGNNKVNHLEENLFKVLKPHNDKEESILYPWIDKSIPNEALKEVMDKLV
ncbi:MAG: Iron-sulfur cluster repair protein YtfE [Candidatus Heimdallarchaeota archaeon LC_2]|nr:MAG: Iron-sulfur cluster repair protein YtfE [Candidatus Heimdallarchaeota archaeon LC_2]